MGNKTSTFNWERQTKQNKMYAKSIHIDTSEKHTLIKLCLKQTKKYAKKHMENEKLKFVKLFLPKKKKRSMARAVISLVFFFLLS